MRPPLTGEAFRDALQRADDERPRSAQTEIGASELGLCRRRVAYRLAGTEPTDHVYKGAALMGTGLHTAVLPILGVQLGMGVEVTTRHGGTVGHADLVRADTEARHIDVVDLKTKAGVAYEHALRAPIGIDWDFQTATYAEGLRQDYEKGHGGEWTATCHVLLLNRDNGDTHLRSWAHDPATAAAAQTWLEEVRSLVAAGSPEWAPRGRYGPRDEVCQGCPFATACWGRISYPEQTGDDPVPELAAVVDAYAAARRAVAAASDEQDRARALVDAIGGYSDREGRRISWSGGKASTVDDGAAALAMLDAAGIPRPQTTKTSARRINVSPAVREGK